MAQSKHRPVDPKLHYLSPDQLDFDPNNPRFGGLATGKSPEELQAYLFGEPYYASELVDSLLENGYIDYEPLVVRRNGQRYTVVEGNRRLAAVREIRANPDKYSGRKSDLERIPVLVFPDTPDEQQQNEMRVYLGVRHLLGFREWPPLSKAQFLDQESRAVGDLDRVIKEVRLTKTNVRRFLVPLRLLKHAKLELPSDGEDFWRMGEALNRAGIKKFLQLEVDPKSLEIVSYEKKNLRLLLDYLYGPLKPGTKKRDGGARVVHDTRELSRLSRVLESDDAAATLRNGASLDEAEILVDSREESIKRLAKVTAEIRSILKKLRASSRHSDTEGLITAFGSFEAAAKKFVSKNAKSSV
jgi:hypothetical protein